jgi:hypothetical protein
MAWVPLQESLAASSGRFNVILQATDAGEWDAIADKRRNDLMVYLALSHFGKRPKFKDLSPTSPHRHQSPLRQLPASLHRRRPDADDFRANRAD